MRAWCLVALAGCAGRPLDLPLTRPPPDLSAWDSSASDLSMTAPADIAVRDLGVGDLSAHDLATADLTSRDLFPPPDLAPLAPCQQVTLSTLAGNGTNGQVDGTGGPDGTTELDAPIAVAVDGAGFVYASDDLYRIRKIAPDGSTTTLVYDTTEFYEPGGLAVDGAGNVWVADTHANLIRKVSPEGTTTLVPIYQIEGSNDPYLEYPQGIVVDGDGTLYVADSFNARVLKMVPFVSTSVLAGNGTWAVMDGTGGPNGTAEIADPHGLVFDAAGNLYVGGAPPSIRRIAPDGTTTTFAGKSKPGFADGPAASATFYGPDSLAIDAVGNIYVGDYYNHAIRRVAPDGTTTTLAGNGTLGYAEGVGCDARLSYPSGVAVFGKQLFIADTGNNRVRKLQLP
jgi:sugar lactone lactonase YvrE